MAGGLIQVATYGSQDLFLTGTPEITFFKVVYRRHTAFSMESIQVPFDDPVGFGTTSSITLPRIGDLVHKTYLEVDLPVMDLKRSDASDDLVPTFRQAEDDYITTTSFMSINREAYLGAYDIALAENTTSSDGMIAIVNLTFNQPGAVDTINNFRNLLISTPMAPFTYDEVSMQSVIDRYTVEDSKDVIIAALTVALNKSIKTQDFFFKRFRDARNASLEEQNKNIKFAWVDRVGHAIVKEIEVRIGGEKIDRHWGDWLNIWYELSANRDMQPIYYKLIGNVKELTTFDRVPKPAYKLRIPLQFWFCRHSGMSIPLVALEYHDVTLQVKFRNIQEVCYIEEGKKIYISNVKSNIFLEEVPEELHLNIQSSLLVDYIYLDSNERRRFAQSAHEYLIDQTQLLEMSEVTQPIVQCNLDYFVNPGRELIWVSQKNSYVNNLNNSTQLRWDKYSLTDQNIGNPIAFTTIDFHSYNRVQRLDGNYFNYVQPAECHNATPSDGINMYSFSIFPEENQPSGNANFSRISRVLITLEFDNILFPVDGTPAVMNVRFYLRSLNILRIISGLGGIAYSYG